MNKPLMPSFEAVLVNEIHPRRETVLDRYAKTYRYDLRLFPRSESAPSSVLLNSGNKILMIRDLDGPADRSDTILFEIHDAGSAEIGQAEDFFCFSPALSGDANKPWAYATGLEATSGMRNMADCTAQEMMANLVAFVAKHDLIDTFRPAMRSAVIPVAAPVKTATPEASYTGRSRYSRMPL